MIRKILKWIGIVLGALVGSLLLAIAVLYLVGSVQLDKTYTIQPEAVPIPTSEEAIARGEHIATIRACKNCHTENLGGQLIFNIPVFQILASSNLTSGEGGIGDTYTDEDWIRAIRHGVASDGRALMPLMQSQIFYYLSDEDLGALIAYLKTLPPVDNKLPKRRIGPARRIAQPLGVFPRLPAALIDHDAPRPATPEPGVTVEYGEYLARSCTECHMPLNGDSLNGRLMTFSDGEQIGVPNLTPGGELAYWSKEDFFTALRTGVTPSGHKFNNMPWEYFGQMTDEELSALWLYLQSLPALEQGK